MFPHLRPARPQVHTARTDATSNTHGAPSWLLDSGASSHVASNLADLQYPQLYDGPDDVILGNNTSLGISHIGSSTLSNKFSLSNVLYIPSMKRNIISVSQFCCDNSASIEFFPSYFLVKDLRTRATLHQGRAKGNLYDWSSSSSPSISPEVHSVTRVSPLLWHSCLGHPSLQTTNKLLAAFLPSTASSLPASFHCTFCLSNKCHKLPFGISSVFSKSPLDIIYSDVWGPCPVTSIDGFRYYVIFIDHFTKYIWFFPLRLKSDVASIFPTFARGVQNQFNCSIKTLYTDGGGEFTALKPILDSFGITHKLSPPYTPEHNGTAERRHWHIVETARTLLHHASIPPSYWPHAFHTAVYLINRLPSSTLANSSPYFMLFGQVPSYTSLHQFGCLCYPWLRPYTHSKLEPRSRPCVFLGYDISHHAYSCLDPASNKIFISRHVRFIEDVFPFASPSLSPPSDRVLSPVFATFPVPSPQDTTPTPSIPVHVSPPSAVISQPALAPSPSPELHATPSSPLDLAPSAPPTAPDHPSSKAPSTPPPPPLNRHPMITRAKNNIFRPKRLNSLTTRYPTPDSIVPTCAS